MRLCGQPPLGPRTLSEVDLIPWTGGIAELAYSHTGIMITEPCRWVTIHQVLQRDVRITGIVRFTA